jgi:hypothetical protein
MSLPFITFAFRTRRIVLKNRVCEEGTCMRFLISIFFVAWSGSSLARGGIGGYPVNISPAGILPLLMAAGLIPFTWIQIGGGPPALLAAIGIVLSVAVSSALIQAKLGLIAALPQVLILLIVLWCTRRTANVPDKSS